MNNTLLAGIRILDLSRLLPGPFCTLYLAQMGAEVIKIEEPDGGDYARGEVEMFALVNRGKQSITLDLRQPADQAQFKALVKTADVVIESFRPGVMARFGCDYDSLKLINPKLVYAALTGYGQTGPYAKWAGHDMNYLAYAGVLDQIGTARAPALSNVQIADLAGGALTCAMGILAAVIGAQKTGVGTLVDVSMMDGSMALQAIGLSHLRTHGAASKRGSSMLTGALPNYALYRCRDGKHLAVGALEPKFFLQLLKVLGEQVPAPLMAGLSKAFALVTSRKGKRPKSGRDQPKPKADPFAQIQKLLTNPERARLTLAPVRLALQAVFLTKTRDEWARLLSDRDTCVAPILTLPEALQNEQAQARGMVQDDGGKPAFALPVRFSSPLPVMTAAPALGADNAKLLGQKKRG